MSSLDGAEEQAFAHGVGSEGVLPRPSNQRWQPLRLGLVDLFYYDDEQFWFHDGRLLLRGNNGTGKSKVLALTLPFLLDGSIAPRRVEPDADPKKRMEWNLLLGGAPTRARSEPATRGSSSGAWTPTERSISPRSVSASRRLRAGGSSRRGTSPLRAGSGICASWTIAVWC